MTLREQVIEILRYPHNKKPERFSIATQIRHYQASKLLKIISTKEQEAYKRGYTDRGVDELMKHENDKGNQI